MKDMYTFSRNQEEHEAEYEKAIGAYYRVYERLGLGDKTFRTYADGGIFTNRFSDEFQTLSSVGEDKIFVDFAKKIAINQEIMSDENLEKLGLKREDLVEQTAIEVGNTFHLESKYTDALDAYFTDENGQRQSIIMGCYGIGVSRLLGTIAETFADEKGLVWPVNVAPAKVYLIAIGEVAEKEAEKLYAELGAKGIEVIYDDRVERPGVKFADAELMGIPYRVTLSERLGAGRAELTERKSGEQSVLTLTDLVAKLQSEK